MDSKCGIYFIVFNMFMDNIILCNSENSGKQYMVLTRGNSQNLINTRVTVTTFVNELVRCSYYLHSKKKCEPFSVAKNAAFIRTFSGWETGGRSALFIDCDDSVRVFTVYFKPKGVHVGGLLPLPISALGTSYMDGFSPKLLRIIGVYDSTEVEIFCDCKEEPTHDFKLEQFKVTSVKRVDFSNCSNLKIESNKQIVVFGITTNYRSSRLEIEQLLPVEQWGQKIAIVPAPVSESYTLYVQASADNTLIDIICGSGRKSITIEKHGTIEKFEKTIADCCFIDANKPVQVVQMFTNCNDEKSAIIVPSFDHYESRYTFSVLNTSHDPLYKLEHYFIGAIDKISNVLLNGKALDGSQIEQKALKPELSEHPCGLVAYKIKLVEKTNTIEHVNNVPFMGIIVGVVQRSSAYYQMGSYGFPAGLKFIGSPTGPMETTSQTKCRDKPDARPRRLQQCKCPKRLLNTKWHHLDGKTLTDAKEETLKDFNENVKDKISLDEKEVTKAIMKKKSRSNQEPSEQSLGWAFSLLLVVPIILALAVDISNYFKRKHHAKKDNGQKAGKNKRGKGRKRKGSKKKERRNQVRVLCSIEESTT